MIRLILLAESRIRGDVYVRFGGEHPKTHHRNMAGHRVFSLPMKSKPVWTCGVSEFDWHYENEETCLVVEGEVSVGYGSKSMSFAAGDLVVFPKGLSCVWNVKKPVRKHYMFK